MHKKLKGKPRLLIILNRFVIGGQAADTIPLAWHLQRDFTIKIICGEKEADEIEPHFLVEKYPGLHLQKIKHLRRSINPFNDVFAFCSLLLLIIRFRPHIVHTHGAKSGFIGRLSAWLAHTPAIIHTFHGHFFHSYFSQSVSRLIAFAERSIGHLTTSAIALSHAQKAELSEKFKILPAEKISIIPLGFEFCSDKSPEQFRSLFRNRYGLQPDDVAIGIVGRMVPVKNHLFFAEVIEQVLAAKTLAPAAFFIIGDGDLRLQVESRLREKKISYNNTFITKVNRVVFTSWLTDIYEIMNGLDIVALTSLNEGTPLSLIEAQFFKRPVVSTDAGGVADTVQDGITGFITGVKDVDAFSSKVQLLINNEDARTSMGEAGFSFVSATFSKQHEVNAMKQHYQELLARQGYS